MGREENWGGGGGEGDNIRYPFKLAGEWFPKLSYIPETKLSLKLPV